MTWDKVWELRRKREVVQQGLNAERSKRVPNLGALHRLERELRGLDSRIARALAEKQDSMEEKRAKARAKLERRRSNPQEEAARLERKAQRLVEKAQAIRAGRPLKRGKPLPARGPKYAEKREAQFSIKDGYRDYIVGLPCVRCQKPGPGDPMHILGVDLGGKAEHMLPGCRACHTWQETHKKAFEVEFEAKHGLTALEMASALRAAYLLDKGLA